MADRAASEVLSFALVFGMVVAAVAVVSVSGLGSLQDARDAEQINNAQRAFDVLADNMADIHQRGAPSRATEISLGSAQLYTDDNVTINVTAIDDSGDNVSVERPVRPLVYDGNEERQLIYEGGAVFRTTRDGGLVNNDPPFLFRDDRVLVPIVQTRTPNVRSVGGATILVRANRRATPVPVADATGRFDNVSVNVTSPRWALWQEHFEETALSRCDPEPADERVTCYLEPGASTDRVYVVVHEIDVEIER